MYLNDLEDIMYDGDKLRKAVQMTNTKIDTSKFTAVDSSNIRAIFFEDGRGLYVQFHNGGVYQYAAVDRQLYMELMEAESKGKFLNANIKNKFDYVKVQ